MGMLSFLNNIILTGILTGGLYALMAMGLSLVFGVMNIPNFAYGEFYMIGAYLAFFGIEVFGWGPIPSILFAMAGGFIFGAVIEKSLFYPLRQRSKENWLMNTFLLTLGLSIILQNGMVILYGANYHGITYFWPGNIRLGPVNISYDRAVAFLIAIVAIVLFSLFLNKTRTGRAIRAVSQDETGAKLMGIDLNGIHMLTFALSSLLAALAGASLLSISAAYPTMGVTPLYTSWFVLILVGMGNVEASIWGGFIVGILETLSTFYLGSGWQSAVSLGIIILILLFKPAGIFAKKGVKTVWE